MKLYFRIMQAHKLLFFLLLLGMFLGFLCSGICMYMEISEHIYGDSVIAVRYIYVVLLLMVYFNLYMIAGKLIAVCRPELCVLLLVGSSWKDILIGWWKVQMLCEIIIGIAASIVFFCFVWNGNMKAGIFSILGTWVLQICFAVSVLWILYRKIAGESKHVPINL